MSRSVFRIPLWLRNRIPPSLRNGKFAWYEITQLLSSIGNAAQVLAITLLVFQETGSPWYLALSSWIVLGCRTVGTLPGETLADKLPRNYLLRGTAGAQAALAAGLCVMDSLGYATIVVLLVAQAVAGILGGVVRAVEPALVFEIVSREMYENARYVNTIQVQAGSLLGPVIVTPLTALHLSLAWAFGVNSASFSSLLFLLLFRLEQGRARPVARGDGVPIGEAVKFLRQNKETIAALGLFAWTLVCIGNASVMQILIAVRLLGGKHVYPLLALASALGTFAIGVYQASRQGKKRTSMRTLATMAVVSAAFSVPYGVSHWLVVSMVCLIIVSIGLAYLAVTVSVMIVQRAGNELVGRLNAIFQMIQQVAIGVSNLLAAILVAHWGVSVTMIATGVAGLLFPGILYIVYALRRQ